MGTGKTKMAIEVLRKDLSAGGLALIMCPSTVIGVWRGECRKHAAGVFDVLALDSKSMNSAKKADQILASVAYAKMHNRALLVVVNYESAITKNITTTLLSLKWNVVICDESQRIKGHGSITSKLAAKLSRLANRRICLTGTPMDNDPGDAFAQYRFLDSEIFGPFWTHFTKQYAVMNPYIPQKVDKWVNTEDFSRRYNSICYKISKDVLDLPECQHIRRDVSLTGEGLRIYKEMKKNMLAEIRQSIVDENGNSTGEESIKMAVADNGAVRYLRLLQLAQGYVKTEEKEIVSTDGCKKRILLELLEQTDEPVVVYGFFTPDLQCVKECAKLLGKSYGEVSGSRKDLTKESKYPDNVDILGVQCLSGGTGIDLTKSRIGIIMNTGLLSPGNYDQMLARQYRPGQDRNVIFYHLITTGTIDEEVGIARDKKRDVIEAIVNGFVGNGRHDECFDSMSDNEFLLKMAVGDSLGIARACSDDAAKEMDDFF